MGANNVRFGSKAELFAALKIGEEQQTKEKAQRIRTTMEATLGWRHRESVRIYGRVRNGYAKEGVWDL